VPAGTAVRFEPGVTREVTLVPFTGRRVVPGLRPEHAGPLDGNTPPGGPMAARPAGGQDE
jgi:urease subunit beta